MALAALISEQKQAEHDRDAERRRELEERREQGKALIKEAVKAWDMGAELVLPYPGKRKWEFDGRDVAVAVTLAQWQSEYDVAPPRFYLVASPRMVTVGTRPSYDEYANIMIYHVERREPEQKQRFAKFLADLDQRFRDSVRESALNEFRDAGVNNVEHLWGKVREHLTEEEFMRLVVVYSQDVKREIERWQGGSAS